MASNRIGPIAKAWYQWKALRLPWRKRFLMGFDLQGNTYWEFRLTRGSGPGDRFRRIVKYPRSTHLSSVKVSPQWHQWLRYTRDEPPSLDEQEGDVVRRARLKVLAAEADARWEAKPRVMDAPPGESEHATAAAPRLPPQFDAEAAERQVGQGQEQQQPPSSRVRVRQNATAKEAEASEDPWAKARAQGPSEDWQPAAWDPSASTTKRR